VNKHGACTAGKRDLKLNRPRAEPRNVASRHQAAAGPRKQLASVRQAAELLRRPGVVDWRNHPGEVTREHVPVGAATHTLEAKKFPQPTDYLGRTMSVRDERRRDTNRRRLPLCEQPPELHPARPRCRARQRRLLPAHMKPGMSTIPTRLSLRHPRQTPHGSQTSRHGRAVARATAMVGRSSEGGMAGGGRHRHGRPKGRHLDFEMLQLKVLGGARQRRSPAEPRET
jgi:hypothetical protein